jgi:hypothetical protein
MRDILAAAMFAMLALPAAAAEIRSEYTDIDFAKSCSIFDIATEGGEFANLVCNGWRGYPVLIYQGDLRESVVYGFPPAGEHRWETFGPFNSTSPKIEWRIEKDGDKEIPFATIHRWQVSNPEDPDKNVEVLVVEKVGQIGEQQPCAVGLVLATGNPQANETARRIADEQVRGFVCGADERVLVGEPMPDFYRAE